MKSDLVASVASAIKGRYRMGADTPLRLSDHDWPEPDLFLTPLQIRQAHASGPDTLLVVEVADTSLTADLGENAVLYAAHGVREYWVVDLVHSRVHVHLLSTERTYPSQRQAPADELLRPTLADVVVRLADML